MADGKGYNVIAKFNLPPEENYHSGHSLIVQGDTASEVRAQIAEIIAGRHEAPTENTYDQAQFILLRFIEFAQGGAVQAALGGTESGSETPESSAAGPATSSEAAPGPDLASAAVLKAVAKKTGKTVEELGELSTADAQKLLKKEVKK